MELEDVFKEKAKEIKAEKISEFRKTGEISQISDKPDTKKDLAKIANVSHDTIAKVKKIEAFTRHQVKAWSEAKGIGSLSIIDNEAEY